MKCYQNDITCEINRILWLFLQTLGHNMYQLTLSTEVIRAEKISVLLIKKGNFISGRNLLIDLADFALIQQSCLPSSYNPLTAKPFPSTSTLPDKALPSAPCWKTWEWRKKKMVAKGNVGLGLFRASAVVGAAR